MASTPQPYQGGHDRLESPVPRSADGRLPEYAWSPDLRLMLDRVETAPAADGRWAASADGGFTAPQWQPPPPPHFQQAAEKHLVQLPRAGSGPSHLGGWYTSTDLAMKWLRPTPKPRRASSAPIAHDFEPQLASPIRKPGRSHFQSSVRRQPAPAGTTIRVVSSDWTPEGFERTVGVVAERPQWSPLLRKSLTQSPREAPAAHGHLRTLSHPPTLFVGADGAAHASPVGSRVSWPPASFPPSHDGGWAANPGTPQLPKQPRGAARHAVPMAAPSPALPPPVPALPVDYYGQEQASQTATIPPRGWHASVSWAEGMNGAAVNGGGYSGGSQEAWPLEELEVFTLASAGSALDGSNGPPRLPNYVNGHLPSHGRVSQRPDYAGGHTAVQDW